MVDKREGSFGFHIGDLTHELCCSASAGVNSCNKEHEPSKACAHAACCVCVCVAGVLWVCCGSVVGVLWVSCGCVL